MKKEGNVNMFLTGGHGRSTGYAVFEEIKKRHKDIEFFWVGSSQVFPGQKVQSIESVKFSQIGLIFLAPNAGRIQRKFTLYSILEVLKAPIGIIQSIFYVSIYKPKVIISFGGFASFPVNVAGFLFGVPIIIHEQTSSAGRANLFSQYFASRILLARDESREFYSKKDKLKVVGNPISSDIRELPAKANLPKTPTILVAGGASGSLKINEALKRDLKKILTSYIVIHQVGDMHFKKFNDLKSSLPDNLAKRYFLVSSVAPWEWHKLLKKADILVSRSGANIVSQAIYLKLPSIFIPIPFSYLDEQNRNAQLAVKSGIGIILPEEKMQENGLFEAISGVRKNWNKLKEGANLPNIDAAAHSKFANIVEEYLTKL